MYKIIIPLFSIILLSGCDFLKTVKTSKIQIKSVQSNVISINNINRFEEIALNSNKPAVVKFETQWCSACKTMAPIYANIANKYLDKIVFITVDTGQLPELADKYAIQGVPTFIFFKNGKKVSQIEGAVGAEQFEKMTRGLL